MEEHGSRCGCSAWAVTLLILDPAGIGWQYTAGMLERLQKILSARGIASRRKAEEYIKAGVVKVNGEVATLGQKADPERDVIVVDGTVLTDRRKMLYYVLHKPVGIVTENLELYPGSSKAPNIRSLLPKNVQGKVFPVGRLDKDSSGLLLLTNDGVVAYRLTHPKFSHEKEYEVTTVEPITDGQLRKMAQGMKILGEVTKPARVRRVGPSTFRIALTEGKNRQIRRMCQKVGAAVAALRRIRIATLEDHGLAPGQLRPLTDEERAALLKALGLPVQ